jgi:uncharacterized protein (TIGR03663 family)
MICIIAISLSREILPAIDVPISTELTLNHRLEFLSSQFSNLIAGRTVTTEFATFLTWTGALAMVMLAIILGPALWVYRRVDAEFSVPDVVAIAIGLLLWVGLATFSSVMLGLTISLAFGLVYGAFRFRSAGNFGRTLAVLIPVTVIVLALLIAFEEASHAPSREGEPAAQPAPGEAAEVVVDTSGFTTTPLVLTWFVCGLLLAFLAIATQRGIWSYLDRFPEFDIMLLLGSLILPWLAGALIYATNSTQADHIRIANDLPQWLYDLIPKGNAPPQEERAVTGHVVLGFIAWLPMMIVAITAGLLWNWRRWLVASLIFHALFAFFYTTVFTNIQGLATGMVYSLEYWLEQQGERRGSQPQYYYLLVIMPFYEFLPVIGGALAMIAGMVVFWRQRRAEDEPLDAEAEISDTTADESADSVEEFISKRKRKRSLAEALPLVEIPFLLFMAWWAVFNLLAYTLAGEKMPWLGTHMTVPLIFLTAWYFGRILDRFDLRQFTVNNGWLYAILLPFLIVALFQLFGAYLGGQAPFQGNSSREQNWTNGWLAALGISALLLYFVLRLVQSTGWPHLRHMVAAAIFSILAVITFRSAWMASFVNYDLPNEYLVYAHGGTGNTLIAEQIRELSERTTGGTSLQFAYGNRVSWPGSWYFRNFEGARFYGDRPTRQLLDEVQAVVLDRDERATVEPLLGDQFIRFDYVRMTWPMQDYFDLNAARINNLLDFDTQNQTAGATRRGVFDIWWQRDYERYAMAVGRSPDVYDYSNWPVRDVVHFYVRRDIAAQVWQYGTGDLVVAETEVNQCAANWTPLQASLIFDTSQHPLIRPIDLDVTDEGRVYIAEEGIPDSDSGHRISVFTTEGEFVTTFGQAGMRAEFGTGPYFNRPHSVAVAPDGRIYVVDTWNYRVSVFSSDYEYLTSWGEPLSIGPDAPVQPVGGFWGPREAAIDDRGYIYVADTGNERVRVYTLDGTYVDDIGMLPDLTGGSLPGLLDEPTGVVIDPGGSIYVADTFNRRVSVFNPDFSFQRSFDVRGWSAEMALRPYMALDSASDLLYIADPDVGLILVYDTAGNCIGSFGQYNPDNPDASQFASIGGMDVDSAGNLYVSDILTGRVLRFAPFPRPQTAQPEASAEVMPELTAEVTAEVSAEMTAETTLEIILDLGGTEEITAEATPETTPEETPEATETE